MVFPRWCVSLDCMIQPTITGFCLISHKRVFMLCGEERWSDDFQRLLFYENTRILCIYFHNQPNTGGKFLRKKIIDNKIYYDLFLRLPSSFYHIFLLFLISVIKGHHWNIYHFTELMRGTCKWKNNRINLKYYDGEEYRSETSNAGYLTVSQKRNSEHDLFTY